MNISRELIVTEKKSNNHFSKIASNYKELRTTDVDHIEYIKHRLDKKTKINIADIGCGDGRYSLEILKTFKNCYLHCIDYNENMILYLKKYLLENKFTNFCARSGDASKLSLENNSMDCIVSFNAIHHFDLEKFFSEVYGSLKDNGRLFIYTRLRNQNYRSIWGEYFPTFGDVENRLFELNELEEYVENSEMSIKSTRVFGHARTSTLKRLVHQAKNNHYSTFTLYDEDTFKESLDIFQNNIRKNFNDLEQVTWHDENILLEIEK
ncbi:MAG: class I SAM-dependent methyltransferase [Candidatus Nitrosopumilus sp. bin_68KS]